MCQTARTDRGADLPVREQLVFDMSGRRRHRRARPFLKWAGGKSQLLTQYAPLFPAEFTRYFEPFLGSGAVFFHLLHSPSYLSDLNDELVNLYRVLRDSVDALLADLSQHENTREYYYSLRSARLVSPIERASRILYLNKTCFNGLYRENRKGEFNVPFGNYAAPNWRDEHVLRAASDALKACCVHLETTSFDSVLQEAQPGDFVYFDPPYIPLNTTSSFTSYDGRNFTVNDHRRLAAVMMELHRRGVYVMLSNSASSATQRVFTMKGFHFTTVLAARSINSVGSRRGSIPEFVIRNYVGTRHA
jgi:DNA adenine methylase